MPMEERKGYQWKEGTKEVMPMDGRKEGRDADGRKQAKGYSLHGMQTQQ